MLLSEELCRKNVVCKQSLHWERSPSDLLLSEELDISHVEKIWTNSFDSYMPREGWL
jgi:hypothetical protein